MILYCYYCPDCSHEWENQHMMADRLNEKCPECGTKARIDFSAIRHEISCYDLYPVRITDLTPHKEDEHTVHSKYEHKELFKKYGRESPAFMQNGKMANLTISFNPIDVLFIDSFKKGMQDKKEGKHILENPYPGHDYQHEIWLKGYDKESPAFM